MNEARQDPTPLQRGVEAFLNAPDWNERVITLLQRIAEHFDGTDSPIGVEAARLLGECFDQIVDVDDDE